MPRLPKAAPTHGWLISNKILRYFAWCFIITAIFIFVFWSRVTYSVDRNCNDPYRQKFRLFGYWVQLNIGKHKTGCADE